MSEPAARPALAGGEGAGEGGVGGGGGGWLGWYIQAAKDKSAEALSLVKRDLAEFTATMHDDGAKVASSVKEKLTQESASAASERVRQGVSSLLGGLSKALVVPPSDDYRPARILGGEPVMFDRAKARLHALQVDPQTYTVEPVDERYQRWLATFDLDTTKGDISQLLVSNMEVRALYTQLVPLSVSNVDFWRRYTYRVQLHSEDEARRRELRKRAEAATGQQQGDDCSELGWGDDDEDSTDEAPSSSNTTQAPPPSSTHAPPPSHTLAAPPSSTQAPPPSKTYASPPSDTQTPPPLSTIEPTTGSSMTALPFSTSTNTTCTAPPAMLTSTRDTTALAPASKLSEVKSSDIPTPAPAAAPAAAAPAGAAPAAAAALAATAVPAAATAVPAAATALTVAPPTAAAAVRMLVTAVPAQAAVASRSEQGFEVAGPAAAAAAASEAGGPACSEVSVSNPAEPLTATQGQPTPPPHPSPPAHTPSAHPAPPPVSSSLPHSLCAEGVLNEARVERGGRPGGLQGSGPVAGLTSGSPPLVGGELMVEVGEIKSSESGQSSGQQSLGGWSALSEEARGLTEQGEGAVALGERTSPSDTKESLDDDWEKDFDVEVSDAELKCATTQETLKTRPLSSLRSEDKGEDWEDW